MINKVIAVVAGPAGMALIGQVQNVASILQGASSGLFTNAVVKHTAEWRDRPERRQRFLTLSYTLVFWITIAVGTATFTGSWFLARSLLSDTEYWWVFALLGMTIPILASNNLVLSVINGSAEIKKLTAINIVQSVVGLVIAVSLPLAFGLSGALAATVLASAVVFVVLLPELKAHTWMRLRRVDLKADSDNLSRLKGFALMALTSAICAPLAQILVRKWIVEQCSIEEAGYWQALMRFSSSYLNFFTTTLSVYFLPRFSYLKCSEIAAELGKAYRTLLPIIALIFIGIWSFREQLVTLLFSVEFAAIASLLIYQLVGDFMKIGSWLLAYVMLGQSKTRLFVVSEILFSAVYVGSAMFFVGRDGGGGVKGALLAWIVTYTGYWIFLWAAMRDTLSERVVDNSTKD